MRGKDVGMLTLGVNGLLQFSMLQTMIGASSAFELHPRYNIHGSEKDTKRLGSSVFKTR